MEPRTRLAAAAGGTVAIALGVRQGGLILEPEIDSSPPDVNGYAWFLALLGIVLLVRAAGGHRTVPGCVASIAGIVLLSSPFWGSTITFFLIVLPLSGAAIGSVIISAATALKRSAADRETSADEPPRTSARRLLTAVGTILVLASLIAFVYVAHLLSQIKME
jgi:hypothetical protein